MSDHLKQIKGILDNAARELPDDEYGDLLDEVREELDERDEPTDDEDDEDEDE